MSKTNILTFPLDRRAADSTEGPAKDNAAVIPFKRAAKFADTFTAQPQGPATEEDLLELGELWGAITEGRLQNFYQPQYDLATDRFVALEALVRIIDEDGMIVPPDRFIRQAEESGLIIPLGRTVIQQACRDLAHLRSVGIDVERVSINLSAHQINMDVDLPEFIGDMVGSYGLKFSDLEFELTERQALEAGGQGTHTLRVLSAAGARLAIDDFGTGYSSVAYLSELPIDTVKLDRSMIARLPEDNTTLEVIRHLLNMGEALGVTTVAEGVETDVQNELLNDLNCDLGQGYLKARPLPLDELTVLMKRQ
ncbi:MAG: EAL domain-containing protein [Pseudomonadota bacterium]